MDDERASKPLFEVVNNSKIVFDPVYLNGIHSLKRLQIKSLCHFPLIIKLRSNLGAQVMFQLRNENLSIAEIASSIGDTDSAEFLMRGDEMSSESNVTSFKNMDTRPNHQNINFNETFNCVDQIEHMRLEPFSTERLIVGFLPDANVKMDYSAARIFDTENTPFKASAEETYDFFSINGVIFLFAFKLDVKAKIEELYKFMDFETPSAFIENGQDNPETDDRHQGAPDYKVNQTYADSCKNQV
jgi:hypothetical protein